MIKESDINSKFKIGDLLVRTEYEGLNCSKDKVKSKEKVQIIKLRLVFDGSEVTDLEYQLKAVTDTYNKSPKYGSLWIPEKWIDRADVTPIHYTSK